MSQVKSIDGTILNLDSQINTPRLSPRTIREWLELIPFDRARKEAIGNYQKVGNYYEKPLILLCILPFLRHLYTHLVGVKKKSLNIGDQFIGRLNAWNNQ